MWQELLRSQQLTESQGWEPSDIRFGGWSYAAEPPRKPTDGKPLPPLSEPNLSATLFAIEALIAAGANDAAIANGLSSAVRGCKTGSPERKEPRSEVSV